MANPELPIIKTTPVGTLLMSRIDVIARRNTSNLAVGFYHIYDAIVPVVVFASAVNSITAVATNLNDPTNLYVYDIDTDTVRLYSGEEVTIDISGASSINMSAYPNVNSVILVALSEPPFALTIDDITEMSGLFPITFRAAGNLAINFRDSSISGGNLHLETTPTTIEGNNNDIIVFEKRGGAVSMLNVRNYLSPLITP